MFTGHDPATAFTGPPLWGCRSSAVFASVAGNNRVEPIVANGNPNTGGGVSPDRAQCVNQDAGLDNLATPLGIPTNVLGASSATAQTSIMPEIGKAIDQKPTSQARVENLQIPLTTSTVVLGVAAATSSATGTCKAGSLTPTLTGTSQVTGLTLGGQNITLDALLAGLQQVLAPLSPVIDVKFNEQIRTASSLIVNAAHIKILSAAGRDPLADIVIAQSKVVAGADVCDPDKQLPPGTGNGEPCPAGSTYLVEKNLCVIIVAGGSTIIVGKPYEGPSGGTVIPLADARKRYPNSPCVRGPGPKFAVIGTNKRDFITGSNGPTASSRSATPTRSTVAAATTASTPAPATTGRPARRATTASTDSPARTRSPGDLGNDKIYGGTNEDHLNGGPGIDYLYGESGNDTLNGGYNADHLFGGSGNDALNIAQQGPAATADCGSGKDKIRMNKKERDSREELRDPVHPERHLGSTDRKLGRASGGPPRLRFLSAPGKPWITDGQPPMTPTTTVPTRERLLNAALELFAEHGFTETTVGDIEKAAGLVPRSGAMYKHFASKDELLHEAVGRFIEGMQTIEAGVFELFPLGDMRAEATLLARATMAHFSRQRDFLRIVFQERPRIPHLIEEMHRGAVAPAYAIAAIWVQRQVDAGLMGPCDAEAVGAILVIPFVGYRLELNLFEAAPGGVDEERFVNAWIDLVMGYAKGTGNVGT